MTTPLLIKATIVGSLTITGGVIWLYQTTDEPTNSTPTPTPTIAISHIPNNAVKTNLRHPIVQPGQTELSSAAPLTLTEQAKNAVEPAANTADAESEVASVYDDFDREIEQSLSSSPPAWFYQGRDVYAEVEIMYPGAYISSIQCSSSVCKVEVQHPDNTAREDVTTLSSSFIQSHSDGEELALDDLEIPLDSLPEPISEDDIAAYRLLVDNLTLTAGHMTTYYRYPANEPDKTVMYNVKTELPELNDLISQH